MGDLHDSRGVRRGDHLPPHKYIGNTSTCGTTPSEHLLNADGRPHTSQKIYIFPSSLFVSVYVYAPCVIFVGIALLLLFVLGFCLSVFLFFSYSSKCLLSLVDLLFGLVALFFLFFFFFFFSSFITFLKKF